MSSDHCYTPLPDTTRTVRLGWMVGCVLSGIGYGALLVVGHACYTGLRRKARSESGRGHSARFNRNTMLIIYVVFTLLLATVAEVIDLYVTINSALDDACFFRNLRPPNPLIGRFDILLLMINLTTDGLYVWRCYTASGGLRGQRGWLTLVWVLPLVVYIVMLCTGLTVTIRLAIFNTSGGFADILSPIQYGITGFLNVLVTLCISILMLHYRRLTIEALGKDAQVPYLNLMAVLIESASLALVIDVLALVGYVQGNLGNVATQIWIPMQPMASLLIIYRVSQGSDYFQRRSEEISTLRFGQVSELCPQNHV